MITMKVEGLDKLLHALNELPKELHRGPLRAAVSAGAKVVQEQAMVNILSNQSVDSGTLMESVYRARSRRGSSAVQEMQIVGVRFGKRYRRRGIDAWYWRFLEFGTSKMGAKPFLRPAFDATIQQQIEAIRERLKKGIDTAVVKLKSKSRLGRLLMQATSLTRRAYNSRYSGIW